MRCEQGELESLDALREEPLQGEQSLTWAIQIEDDEETRQALPGWIVKPIERGLVKWSEERQKWLDKIDDRMAAGKNLTPAVQKQYDKWCDDNKELCLLFSKHSQCVVHSLRKNVNPERVKTDMFSVQVALSPDPSDLVIQVGTGEAVRLVLLKGQPLAGQGIDIDLPYVLDQSIADGVVEKLEKKALRREDDMHSDHGDDQDVGQLQEEDAMVAKDFNDSDLEEVLAGSSDDEELDGIIPGKFTRVKTFMHRESYKSLDAMGLSHLPPGGVHISYHKGTRQWTGYFPGRKSEGLCFSHGGSTHRSEGEALLLVIKGLLEAYLEVFPHDKKWRRQYDKVTSAEATVAKL